MNNAVIAMIAKKTVPTISRRVNRQKLVIKKQSPHIFFVAGIAGSVTSTVLACRATLNLSDTLTEIEGDLASVKKIKSAYDNLGVVDVDNDYPPEQLRRDVAFSYAKAAYKLGRLYGPSVGVGIVSVGLLTGAHVSLSRRNTALMAAYATVSKAYDDYRERVIQELGAEKELDIRHAKIASNSTPDGDEVSVVDPNNWSPYARFFDEGSPHWEKNAEFNRLFVQCQQNYANEKLRAQGHLFLNEVYDMLGIDRSSAGSVVGWVIGKDGDNYVDFGMYQAVSSRFINGWERSILLDFNVDGVIYDKI
jgi:Family of unknown function (DUF6353)